MKNKTINLPRNLLRIFLFYSSAGWLICLIGIFVPKDLAIDVLDQLGGRSNHLLMQDPMYDYWLRMVCGAYSAIGIFYVLLGSNPKKYACMLPWAGIFMLGEALLLFVHGTRLSLPSQPFLGDVFFCAFGGLGILITMKKGLKEAK